MAGAADAKLARYNQAHPGPVGAYPPNGFGLYDMAGGVSECCADWFERFGSNHPSVCQFSFVDGSVKSISNNIDFETYHRLSLRNDGETVAWF